MSPATGTLAGNAAFPALRLRGVRCIWSAGRHNAFTDLLRHRGAWWCAFREASEHLSDDGVLRLLVSPDGARWRPAACIARAGEDLRDPKLYALADGRFMLLAAAALPDGETHQTCCWYSTDGLAWGEAQPLAAPGDWLWRITRHGRTSLGVAYRTDYPAPGEWAMHARLYRSVDDGPFECVRDPLVAEGNPNESAIVFDAGGTAYCLLRRDPGNALFGRAVAPYEDWHWLDCGRRIGGPHMIALPDGRLLAGVRLLDGGERTALCWVDAASGRLHECLALPSGGDTSYPGLDWHAGLLRVSYYSSHEGRSAIYLAEVDLPL